MKEWTLIDYGIVGVVIGALLTLFFWVTKRVLNALVDSRAELQKKDYVEVLYRVDEVKTVVIACKEELAQLLRDRDRVCSYDHDKLVENMHTLTTSTSQLAAVLTYALKAISPKGDTDAGE